MHKHIRWLITEIERWKADGLVSPEQAEQLRQRYEQPAKAAVPWGLLVFATAGAVVIGLGVILLFAYNWDEIPKYGKLALIFAAIIGTHIAAIRLLAQTDWRAQLGEALAVMGTMFYGAGIWLVAQIYNIDEHYPNGFLLWALGALAMAWAIRSTACGLLAAVLITIWGCCESASFSNPQVSALGLVAFGLLPLAWRQRSTLLLALSLAAIQLLLTVNMSCWGGGAQAFTATLAWAVVLVAAARLIEVERPDFGSSAVVASLLGFGAFLVCSYILTFPDAAEHLLDWQHDTDITNQRFAQVFGWSLFTLGLAGWGWVARRRLGQEKAGLPHEDWLLPFALLYCFGTATLNRSYTAPFASWMFNVILVGLAVLWMCRGCRESRLRPTILGSLLLSAVVLARYFDLFESQASRGLAFIVLGIIFVVEAMYYRKIRQAKGGVA